MLPHCTGSNGPAQVDLVIPVEPCVEKLLLSVECFCKEVHTVKESNTYLLVKVIHRTFAASQNVVKPWIWIFSYENIAKLYMSVCETCLPTNNLTAIFLKSGAMPAPTKLQNSTNLGQGSLGSTQLSQFQSTL